MELLRMSGEGVQIGSLEAPDDWRRLVAGQQAFSLQLADGRIVALVGLTIDEARACVPGFMSPARITVSAA